MSISTSNHLMLKCVSSWNIFAVAFNFNHCYKTFRITSDDFFCRSNTPNNPNNGFCKKERKKSRMKQNKNWTSYSDFRVKQNNVCAFMSATILRIVVMIIINIMKGQERCEIIGLWPQILPFLHGRVSSEWQYYLTKPRLTLSLGSGTCVFGIKFLKVPLFCGSSVFLLFLFLFLVFVLFHVLVLFLFSFVFWNETLLWADNLCKVNCVCPTNTDHYVETLTKSIWM